MSHIEVHDISGRARTRLGRTYQVAALAPLPARAPLARAQLARHLWPLDRAPYRHNLPTWAAPEPSELELPPGAPRPREISPPAERAGVAPRARAAAFPAGAPETMSWSYSIVSAGAATENYASTDVIPWPFRIIGFRIIEIQDPVADGWYEFNFFSNQEPFTGQSAIRPGEPLIPRVGSGPIPITAFGVHVRVRDNALATRESRDHNIAAAAIGRAVHEGGKRLIIGVRDPFGFGITWGGHVTVERLAEPGPVTARTERIMMRAPAPAAPTRRSPAGAYERTSYAGGERVSQTYIVKGTPMQFVGPPTQPPLDFSGDKPQLRPPYIQPFFLGP